MEPEAKITSLNLTLRTVIIDSIAVMFVLFVPAWSHLLSIPIYFLEPMRIVLMIVVLFTSRFNAYLIALALPAISFIVSGHPGFSKMLIISIELVINAMLFLNLLSITRKPFIASLISILFSKLICYFLYWIVFSWAFVISEAEPGFLLAQLTISLLLSLLVWAICEIQLRNENNPGK
jgi:hypothetical protein